MTAVLVGVGVVLAALIASPVCQRLFGWLFTRGADPDSDGPTNYVIHRGPHDDCNFPLPHQHRPDDPPPPYPEDQ